MFIVLQLVVNEFAVYYLHKWKLITSELCESGELQIMSHVVNLCPNTRLDGGLLQEDFIRQMKAHSTG